jgi:rfaE bifunctional protein nucleotidyltransferase chain/domain
MILQEEYLTEIRIKHCNDTIILSHGCFDVFHVGHLNYLKESKKLGDILVVSLTADTYIRKGPDRPFFTIKERLSIIDELKCVDYCCISNDFTCIDIIKKLKPNFKTKGVDVKGRESIIGSSLYSECEELDKVNGKLIFVNSNTNISSTKIYNKL